MLPTSFCHRGIVAALLLACGAWAARAPAVGAEAGASAGAGVRPAPPGAPVPIPTRSRQVGTNLSAIAYYASNFPFADLMKSGGGWTSKRDDGTWGGPFPSSTPDGYPTALAPGQHAVAAVAWNGSHYPAGRYTVLWDGEGVLGFPMSRLRIVERGPHRIVVEPEDLDAQMWVAIDATDRTNPVRNVRFLLPGTASTHATQPFNPTFLARTAPFSVLRFMDWGATNGSSLREWADRPVPGDVTYAARGVPLEVMIQLANTLHADPWFCIPHQASDDYVSRFARLVHETLDPTLRPHVEYSNEVWNSGFEQRRWAEARSDALGLARPLGLPSRFYAKRAVEIFRLVRQAYGAADAPRVVRVVAGQAAWTQFLQDALAYGDTAANADAVAVAPYFMAAEAADPAKAATTLTLSPNQIVDQMLAHLRGEVKTWMSANAALAARYKLPLKAYESGFGNTLAYFPAPQQPALVALMRAANAHPRMKDVYAEFHAQWQGVGGDTMLQYFDIGGGSIHGFWGALENVTDDPASAPKYQGLLAAIAARPSTAARSAPPPR